MTDPLHPPLPRRYRLAWILLWFVLLGALLRFGQVPARLEPVARTSAAPAAIRHDGGGIDTARQRTGGGAAGSTAFRQR